MKKNIFKFGAALTAALMVCSAAATVAFAEGDVVAPATETVVSDVVEAPAEEATETPAEDVEEAPAEEVQVDLDTKDVTEADADVQLEAKTDDSATGSSIVIGSVSSTQDESYYNVSVPFTLTAGTTAPSQMTFFVYDITKLTGDQNNTVGFQSETPVGYINQYEGTAVGTYSFKLAKTAYTDDSIIVVKIGGTGIDTPDAKSYVLGGASEWSIGDVNHSGVVDNIDANLIMKYYLEKASENDLFLNEADAYKDDIVDNIDANTVMKYYLEKVDSLPVVPNN